MNSSRRFHLLLACAALLVSACFTPHADYVPTRHIVMFDGDGDPVDPESTPFLNLWAYRKMPREAFEEHLSNLFDGIDQYLGEGAEHPGKQEVCIAQEVEGIGKQECVIELEPQEKEEQRVLLYIHGGLNQQKGTIDRAAHLYDVILQDPDDRAYPIFVNWQSNLTSSYTQHLFFVRQGQDWGWPGVLVSPFVFARDVLSAAANVPFTIYYEFDSFLSGMQYYTTTEQAAAYSVASTLEDRNARLKREAEDEDRDPEIEIRPEIEAEYLQDPAESNQGLFGLGKLVVTLPVKLVTATVVDIFGKGAWDAMLRRIELLFQRQNQYDSGRLSPGDAEGLPRFLERLAEYQAEHENLRVDLVAHSMGTIVANRILDLHTGKRLSEADSCEHPIDPETGEPGPCEPDTCCPDPPRRLRAPKISNIVYMASASTIADFRDSVFPYLLREPDAKLFLLTLHDKAEVNESHVGGLVPAGSLLVWIDNFLTKVRSHVDFRIGRFTPLMLSLHTIETHLRNRIFIKSFSSASEDSSQDPNKHSDFNLAPFWKESFWTPNWEPPLEVADVPDAAIEATEAEPDPVNGP